MIVCDLCRGVILKLPNRVEIGETTFDLCDVCFKNYKRTLKSIEPKYPKSIITDDMTKCYLCGSRNHIEYHHCLNGSNRKWSTKYGLVVPLCHYCHNEPLNGVHHNAERMNELRQVAQRAWEETYGTREEFRNIFGKSWL